MKLNRHRPNSYQFMHCFMKKKNTWFVFSIWEFTINVVNIKSYFSFIFTNQLKFEKKSQNIAIQLATIIRIQHFSYNPLVFAIFLFLQPLRYELPLQLQSQSPHACNRKNKMKKKQVAKIVVAICVILDLRWSWHTCEMNMWHAAFIIEWNENHFLLQFFNLHSFL